MLWFFIQYKWVAVDLITAGYNSGMDGLTICYYLLFSFSFSYSFLPSLPLSFLPIVLLNEKNFKIW